VTRDELVRRTRQLIDEGDRLVANPSSAALKVWLQLTDELLAPAWGSMDRYHLARKSDLDRVSPGAWVRGRRRTGHAEPVRHAGVSRV
jgi:hypothetical protein